MGVLLQQAVIWFTMFLNVAYTVFRAIITTKDYLTFNTGKWPKSTLQLKNNELSSQNLKDIRQVSEDGFGDKNNRYAFAMESFKDHIYVGTSNIERPVPGIYQFGMAKKLESKGAQLWKLVDEATKKWEKIVFHGLGNKTNFAIRKFKTIGDCLLAVTVNHEEGFEVWGTLDGSNWKVLAHSGFGNKHNSSGRGIILFQDHVYITAENRDSGAEIWRIPFDEVMEQLNKNDGKQEDNENRRGAYSNKWQRVAGNGLGNSTTFWFSDFVEFEDELFVGTMDNTIGFSLYRSPNGTEFYSVASGGITTPFNMAAMRLMVFKGSLYVSTMNWVQGFSIFRIKKTSTGAIRSEEVMTHGFSSIHNAYTWQMCVYNDRLYAGTFQNSWAALRLGMFSLFSTGNGTDWTLETDRAFADPNKPWYKCRELGDYGIRTMQVHKKRLYIGTATAHNSCKIYSAQSK